MASLLQGLVNFLRSHRISRAILLVISPLLLFLSGLGYLGVNFFPFWFRRYGMMPEMLAQPFLTIGSISGVVLFLCILSTSEDPVRFSFGGIDLELEPIRKEREEIRQRIERDPSANVLNTIELGLNQITEYYTINKSQARNSFAFSVFAVVTGLVTLVGGAWLFYFGKYPNSQLATLSSIGGILLQFIGGASFYIYNKSLVQLNYFYDKLLRMQDTMLSIQLCNQLDDKSRQSEIRERLILEILTRRGEIIPTIRGVESDGRPVSRKKRTKPQPSALGANDTA